MADRWEELLPFYVAGTLDPAKRAALERHIDGCTSCRRALNEWILISEGVRAEADSWARTLPLPRYNGQFGSNALPQRRGARAVHQRPLALTTMAASFVAVFFLGALVLYMASRLRPEVDTAAPNASEVAVNITAVAATQTALAAALMPASATSTDLGLITNTPFVTITQTFTIVFPPTKTPTPGGGFGGGEGTPLPTITPVDAALTTISTTPVFGCMARATSPDGARIYRTPDTFGEVVDTLGANDFLAVFTTVNGWYELLAPHINLLGWVWSGDVVLVGADCANMPAPSPTAIATPGTCTAETLGNITLRPDPFETSPITADVQRGSTITVLSQSDNGWYMVQALDTSIGWAPIDSVSLTADCTNLPYTPGYLGIATPTPLP